MLGQITTQALAQLLGGNLVGPGDLQIGDLATLEAAVPGCLTFIRSREYAARWAKSQASAAIVTRGIEVPGHDPGKRSLIYVENADQCFDEAVKRGAKVVEQPQNKFYGDRSAQVIDPFGHFWTIATHVEDVSPEEIERRLQAMGAGGP